MKLKLRSISPERPLNPPMLIWQRFASVTFIAAGLVAQPAAAPKRPPVEKEEPDYAFLVNSPYVEEKGEVQVIGAIRFDTRRGNPDQKFSNAFARTEWGLTDRWELDLMTFWTGANFLAHGDSLAGVRYQVLN